MIAPASNTRACRQTLVENSGANGARTCIIVVGRVRTRHLFWRIAVTSVPYLFRLQMAKVQLEKLSEKCLEQRSNRGFGWYTEHEKGLWVVCETTLQASPTLFGQFQKRRSRKLSSGE